MSKQPEEMTAGEHRGILKTKYPEGNEHAPLADAVCWMISKMDFKSNGGSSFFSYEGKFGKVKARGAVAIVIVLIFAVVVLALERMRVLNVPVVGSAKPRAAEIIVIEKTIGGE